MAGSGHTAERRTATAKGAPPRALQLLCSLYQAGSYADCKLSFRGLQSSSFTLPSEF